MIPQYLCRRQCLVLLIFVCSVMSLYIIIINRFAGSNKAKRLVGPYELNIPPDTKTPLVRKKTENGGNDIVETITDIKIAPVVNGPRVIPRVVGTIDGVGCKIDEINPFNAEMMKYMHDFGDHKCSLNKDLEVTVTLNNIHVNGVGIDFLRSRKIVHDEKNGFSFQNFTYLIPPKTVSPSLSKGKSGAIRNDASKRCIIPKYNPLASDDQLELAFSIKCELPEAEFTYSEEGLIIHKLTKKCIGPKDGTKTPPQNTELVVSSYCGAKFDVINEGVLQLVGDGSCVHPLWGGDSPSEGQKLCLYPECAIQKRLTYRWYFKYEGNRREVTDEKHKLSTDMNHVQVQFLSDYMVNTYALTVQPKPLPKVEPGVTPNIIVISIEEASAPHFKRKLPSTYSAMKSMGFVEYKYHAAVAPTSTVNFITTLDGHTSGEGNTEASIFQLAKKHNYVTLFSADDPLNTAVGYDTGVDHNSVPLFLVLKKQFNVAAQTYCVTGQPIYDLTFNYLSSFINAYPFHPKLAVVLLSEITRLNFNYLGYMDKHFSSLLNQFGPLQNTIVIVQTLKGGEGGKLGQLPQGVEEIKRPLLATYVSKDISKKYKFESTRSSQLSTPYDIHVTLRHLISQEKSKHNYGKSLLSSINPRNCLQAAVYPSMCPCV